MEVSEEIAWCGLSVVQEEGLWWGRIQKNVLLATDQSTVGREGGWIVFCPESLWLPCKSDVKYCNKSSEELILKEAQWCQCQQTPQHRVSHNLPT